VFGRNPATGRLSQSDGLPGCLNHRGGDRCRAAQGLLPHCCSIAATDRSLYVASDDGKSVAISAFERDPNSSVLVQIIGGGACTGGDLSEGCTPWNVGSLASSNTSGELVFGPRRFHLYFSHAFVDQSSGGGSCGDQIAVLGASPIGARLGAATQDVTGCAASLATSPDRRSLYGASAFGGRISVFTANAVTGALRRTGCVGQFAPGCTHARQLEFPRSVAVAPNGRRVYVAAASTLGIFKRSLR
jgi:6-phosphogluconolactonase (cycloisomerase 2 family)